MRWLFLLLLVLNVFYYVWHQQEAPLRAKDVTPLSLYRGSQQDIRLLSETTGDVREVQGARRQECLFLGGFTRQESISALQQRLAEMGVNGQSSSKGALGAGYWLSVAPESQRLLGSVQLQNLSKEFNELKHKIMLCEGVAPAE
ncbi:MULTISPECIES: hypothetical protein [Pseudomonas]|jgi:hypothetical protein|uniref:Sporulation domain-containing protein n=1 Tax=Pseudomonas fluorescens TaxID=294 RepID=A0A5E7PZD8_PSEFL|nr:MULTISPECIES: hypothetical protein [Pseudomonas]KPG93248.1 hypothetical protein AK821_24285 [Pseudomonas sp. RIT-PI-r]MCP1485884.1 hypothetical protein [Pseudomonas fluorescens]PRB43158.1 hypothetical protein CQ025_25880 [Pseudomonas sp. MYb3]PRC29026.1 hypothetical protein CQ009_24675 [Pseudomonas sp. MYb2]VVP54911.1 hypothetical protein PS896_05619 [Pseudomonas fluorescens]